MNPTSLSHPRRLIGAAALLALALSPSLALAAGIGADCQKPQDCDPGLQCTITGSTSPACEVGQTCDAGAPTPDTTGTCLEAPKSCMSDADCAAYSACVSGGAQTCSYDVATMTTTCDPVDPNAPKYCAPKPIACDTDASCPEGFECSQAVYDTPCDQPDPAQCPPPNPVKNCAPKEIHCTATPECPESWTCQTITDCSQAPVPPPSGSASSSSGGGDTCTTTQLCVPEGYAAGFGAPVSADGTKGAGDPTNAAGAASGASGSGCELSPNAPTKGLGLAMALVGIAALFGRRRRAA